MNPTEFIEALNEGKTLVSLVDRTIIGQKNDLVYFRTPVMYLEDPLKVDVWAISGYDCVQLFYKNNPVISIRTGNFEVKQE